MNDQPKTPGAMVLGKCKCGSADVSMGYASPQSYWAECGDCGAMSGRQSTKARVVELWNSAPAEQTPAVGVDLSKDHVFRELVNSLRDVAKQYGSTEQLRERISTVLRGHLAPLLAEIQRSRVLLGSSYSAGVAMSKEIDQLTTRIAELEAQIAKANDWSHLKPDMDPPKP